MNIIGFYDVDINILGQIEWFDLIDEILITTLTIPLYSLLKPSIDSNKRNCIALLYSFLTYFIFTLIIYFYVSNLAEFMNAQNATEYLRLQSISLLIGFISIFCILLFTIYDNYKAIIILTILRLSLLVIFDFIFMGLYLELGSCYSEIIVNSIIAIFSLFILMKKKYFSWSYYEKGFLKKYVKIGIFSGIQIFLDNFIYATMVCKMVNMVSESGNYWIANNFIWDLLLIPTICMNEIIKKNNLKTLTMKRIGIPIVCIILYWICTLPFWSWFVKNPMASQSQDIIPILKILVPFYLCYIFSSVIDSWFISCGKTIYNVINSFIINVIYYGILYYLFLHNVFTLNILFVILMFGCGMMVHMIFSILFYIIEQNKRKRYLN